MMNVLALVGGLEVLVLLVIVGKINRNRKLLAAIQRCNLDLAEAMMLASLSRFYEAEQAAKRWASRVRGLQAGFDFNPPPPPRDEHEWRPRFT